MIDDELKIRIKIIAGYVLIAILFVFAGWWIYTSVFNLAINDKNEYEKIYEKSTITSSVISHLYQVDYKGNRLTQSYSSKALNEYNESLKTLYVSIDSLKVKVVSQHQSELINALLDLLKEKNRNTLELSKIQQNAINSDYYERSIEKVIKSNASDSTENIVVISRLSNDTIKSQAQARRNFFQRIGDVFAPPKSAQEKVQIVATLKTDTLRSKQSPSDSVKVALHKAKEEILTNRLIIRKTVASKLRQLITTEQQISVQISLIIAELNQEATRNSIEKIKTKHDTLQYTGRIIAIVAVLAIWVITLFLFFILKDISRSAQYKRELEAARNHAEDLMQSRYKMLLHISHDIKAPLCSITGYLDLMSGSIDADVQKWSQSMKISSSYIMGLLTNLLEYAKLETGKSVIYISSFDIDSMVEDIVTIFASIATDKNICLNYDQTTSIGFISSDAMRIHQIVMNLTSNAVKFTDKGCVNITYALDNDSRLNICISDSGRGIDETKLHAIFDEFTRDERVEGIEGSGLGLAVVRGAVSLLGGTISVKSQLGEGSMFRVSIPVKKSDGNSDRQPQEVASQNILIVDDDPLQLRMVKEMMARSGHIIFCASNIGDVHDIALTQTIDIVLTDLQMGDFSGYTVLQGLRSKGYNMPIVAVSASGQINKEEMKKAGFSNFLCKPFTLSELNMIVSQSTITQEIASLNELMGGDEDAVKEIMDLFIATTVENIELLREYVGNDRMNDARGLCHKMLPMFLQLRLTEIAFLLKEIDEGNFDKAKVIKIITLSECFIAQYRTA